MRFMQADGQSITGFFYIKMEILGRKITIQRKENKGGKSKKWMNTAEIVRDNTGNVISAVNGYGSALYDIGRYLEAFRSVYSTKNFVMLFTTMSELQFPIRAITDRILNANFYLKDYDTDSIIWNNQQINKFLTKPNETQNFEEFLMELVAYYLICGEAYIYSDVSDALSSIPRWKACDNFYILPADCMYIDYPFDVKLFSGLTNSELIRNYRLISGVGNQLFSPNNILHIRDVNLLFDHWKLKGRSRLESLEYPLSNLCAVYEARNVIYVKRGAIGAISSAMTDSAGTVALTKSEKEKMQKTFNEDYGLKREKGQFILSDIPFNFVRFNMSIAELQPFDETLADAIAIAGAFNVPSNLIPRKDQSTFSNQGDSEKSLYNDTVIPLANKIVSMLNTWLGLQQAPGGSYIHADFSNVPCLQENLAERAQVNNMNTTTYLLQYNQGLITYNQMLVGCGYEKIPGSDYYVYDDPNREKINAMSISLHAGSPMPNNSNPNQNGNNK